MKRNVLDFLRSGSLETLDKELEDYVRLRVEEAAKPLRVTNETFEDGYWSFLSNPPPEVYDAALAFKSLCLKHHVPHHFSIDGIAWDAEAYVAYKRNYP